ncbi:MAG: hypothetical protein GTN67_14790 [Hydrotalea flava]|uniref:hypothetical protein n=1 Tax=Hydrotalea TaxID=1004300 RepID=UPI00094389C6|nr:MULTISPECIES: hypothetical protein [Hydrotalea]MBY0349042.1 hypothetical protein [Hydrotalea flava]NIM36544.1 hypothetical protein [Hydrotalea flava]NIM39403.1 hypothetical protein [Hydrotalea flava]NIN04592.1 hypothetical protein [Hydrotalea flava]NIN16264.1 hypothetical protein [Hydrotalea flava]
MNIQQLHPEEKAVSAISLFKGKEGVVTALQIFQNEQLKAHVSKVPALLVCITGKAVFENGKGIRTILLPGDYNNIEPMVKHWVAAIEYSNLLIIK